MARLENQVALVTGGARGIGRGIVEGFVAEGARVLIADIVEDEGEALAAAHPGQAVFHRLDVTRDADWRTAMKALVDAFGAPTVLVNNAGTSAAGSVASTDEEQWRRTIDVNMLGVFLGSRIAIEAMTAAGGSIINMASSRGQRPSSAQYAYSASKAAVLSMTVSTALHCGESGLPIRCNAICPGVIETPLLRQHLRSQGDEEEGLRKVAAMQVMGRIGRPEDIAAAAIYLASDEANFVTGAILNVDGGFRIREL